MAPRTNRTVICSVVFLDIVEYSRKPVAAQIRLKERLNDLLASALAGVASNDRIILDTGDGAAISFLGDPEDALFVSMSLRDALVGPQPPESQDLRMRIGVNLGPVKLITDLNGQPNIIGDGINVAQRIMSFAEPGQILVSRSYYEVISCMSEEHVKLFQYEGARTDKHVREHEVYAVGASHPGIKRVSSTARKGAAASLATAQAAVASRLSETTTTLRHSLRRKPRLAAALAAGLILASAIAVRAGLESGRTSGPLEVTAQSQLEPGAATPLEASTAPKPAAEPKPAPVPAPAPAPAPRVTDKKAAAKPPSPAPAPAAQPAVPRAAVVEPSEPPAPAAPETAKLRFAISPWGEIFVDGRKVGVAPPMRELEVEPGRHRVEVRNSTFPAHEQVVDAKAGQEIRIRHKFR